MRMRTPTCIHALNGCTHTHTHTHAHTHTHTHTLMFLHKHTSGVAPVNIKRKALEGRDKIREDTFDFASTKFT